MKQIRIGVKNNLSMKNQAKRYMRRHHITVGGIVAVALIIATVFFIGIVEAKV